MAGNQQQSGIRVDESGKTTIDKNAYKLSAEQIDAKSQSFKDLLQDEMEKTIDEFEEEINRPIESETDERARMRLKILRNKLTSLQTLYQKALDEYRQSVKAGHANLEQLSFRLREEVSKQTKTKLANLKAVVDFKAGETIDTTEVRALEKAVLALEDFEKNHPELQPIFDKIAKKQDLNKDEFKLVIGLIKPYSIPENKSAALAFETTAAGLLISMMKPAQRFTMIKEFMDSPEGAKTADLIDMFLRSGTLTRIQGEQLFKGAVAKGVVSEKRFREDFEKKLANGYYENEVAKVKDLIKKEITEQYAGRFADNFLNRFVGTPLVGMLLTMLGGTTALFNLLSNRGGGFSETIEKFFTGIYGPVGAVTAVAGVEMMTGSLRGGKSTEWMGLGSGILGDFYLSPGEDVEIARKKTVSAEAIADIYLNTHKAFAEYLENGGFDTMKALGESLPKKENQILTLEGLLTQEKKPEQKKRLHNLKTATTLNRDELDEKINVMAMHTTVLGIKDNADLQNFLDKVKESQFPS